jgi:HSP20 family protein
MFYPAVRSHLRGKNNVDRFFDNTVYNQKKFSVLANIFSDKCSVTIELSIPGFTRRDISIEVTNGALVVYGEYKNIHNKIDQNCHLNEFKLSSFKRSWDLDDSVNVEGIDASYESGILTISIPFKNSEKTSRKIDVQ